MTKTAYMAHTSGYVPLIYQEKKMERIKIGEIVGAVGLKGEFKVHDLGEDMSRYQRFEYIYAGKEKYPLVKSRIQKNVVVLLVEGVDDRDKAEKMRGKEVFIDPEQLPKLPEGTYYIRDLLGFDVVSEEGEKIGILTDILKSSAQPVYVVKKPDGKECYIPGVDAFIRRTDLEERAITVKVIEGLLDG